ncbi:MAG: Hsp20/alpha crystallin family protein [Candidatus Dadabacteria bacterium]|nr:Hsp20/alpha crystallin family protein [Candidatus Dadabacteria bacterium]NIS07327.1 Hsp20/alpha crystallin family protein [Candidatus Dadabacteria bacterium]NIV41271.1 Hsp20 family protein [Candidatus Dadabacteria bacterium]NIX14506.1 Hsp20 family protein [Candidatus Dadabacteria bacterium]NIY20964.1 Hsp20 family protein [Candidatus Dadabacteria bacterium]
MALKRWKPKNMEKWFDELFEETHFPASWMSMPALRRFKTIEEFSPVVDMYDNKDEIVVKAEIPGMKKEDVHVTTTEDSVTIKGEMKKEEEVKEDDYYYSERSSGSFSRTLHLPSKIKTNKVDAKFDNGLLEVHLPKADESKPKEVKINLK